MPVYLPEWFRKRRLQQGYPPIGSRKKMEIDAQDAFDINFFENILKRDPKNVEALELAGSLYSKYNMANLALRIDRRLVRLLPDDARVRYNLACSLCLLGRKDDALDALEQAIALGYDDADWLKQDPDLKSLRGCPEFEALVSSSQDQE